MKVAQQRLLLLNPINVWTSAETPGFYLLLGLLAETRDPPVETSTPIRNVDV